MPKNKIIYSKRVMVQLVEAGFIPITTMPNPGHEPMICWIFEITPEFKDALDKILGGQDG